MWGNSCVPCPLLTTSTWLIGSNYKLPATIRLIKIRLKVNFKRKNFYSQSNVYHIGRFIFRLPVIVLSVSQSLTQRRFLIFQMDLTFKLQNKVHNMVWWCNRQYFCNKVDISSQPINWKYSYDNVDTHYLAWPGWLGCRQDRSYNIFITVS